MPGNWTVPLPHKTYYWQGLGAVWTAAYPYPERMKVVREALHLPEHIVPLTVIPVGYPTGIEKPKDKFNKKQIHYNGW